MIEQETLQWLFGVPVVEMPAVTDVSLGLGQPVYTRLFWAVYLGAAAFSLWDLLRLMQAVDVVEIRPLTVEMMAEVIGCQRAGILGRDACSGRKGQEGALSVLLQERVAWHTTTGRGRQKEHQFAVLPELPILTPKQADKLPGRLREYHESFLGAVRGFDLPEWRGREERSFVGRSL